MTQQIVRMLEIEDSEELLAYGYFVADPGRGELALNSYLVSAEDREYNEVEVKKIIQGLRDQADLLEGALQLEIELSELTEE